MSADPSTSTPRPDEPPLLGRDALVRGVAAAALGLLCFSWTAAHASDQPVLLVFVGSFIAGVFSSLAA